MSISLLTNQSATLARDHLSTVSSNLQQSLGRLSSGSRIMAPADDAGGLAVSMQMGAAIKRQAAASGTISNAMSYLQTQDGALGAVNEIFSRIGELKVLSEDVTKNATDKENYETEFQALQEQLQALSVEKFNGLSLFNTVSLDVSTSIDGEGASVELAAVDLMGIGASLFPDFSDPLLNGDAFNTSKVGGIGGGVSISGGTISLDGGTGAIVAAETKTSFSGPMEISFDINQNGVTGAVFSASIAGTQFYSRVNETGSKNVRMEYDGDNIDVFVDGASTPSQTISGVGTLDGPLSLEGIGGVSGLQQVSNLSVRSTAPAGDASDVANASNLDSLTLSDVKGAIESVATYRSQNGAQQSRLQYAKEQLEVNRANLSAANSRILDVDVATESTALARFNILQQAGASMLSQANQSQQVALKLIG
ncbi:flagellin [Pelagicoccus sp. SDUM812005]|uniref:flagellin n=1 Tax=Pelagicoccus sp. SDUM812005 TaxID=3041257 RepID=UPI00281080D2|nr:flagellin [Pelagicoccus sp. SDUM812005]MDQ8179663.1 flagellin [Pelagicoccus sp. SDUM812005]